MPVAIDLIVFFFSFSAQAIFKLISFDMSLISTQSLIYLYLPNDSYSISCFSVVLSNSTFLCLHVSLARQGASFWVEIPGFPL